MSLCELRYREQWLEKKFVFDLVSLVFDLCDFFLNLKLFFFIVGRGTLPIYILSEIVDNVMQMGHSALASCLCSDSIRSNASRSRCSIW